MHFQNYLFVIFSLILRLNLVVTFSMRYQERSTNTIETINLPTKETSTDKVE